MNSRCLVLADTPPRVADCVIYVMSRDQRVEDNHALVAAQSEALEHTLPLIVVFNLIPKLGVRAREHYEFMVAGLKELETTLANKHIPFVLMIGDLSTELGKLSQTLRPRTVYFDFSPLHGPRHAQKEFAANAECRVAVVDTHNIVPVWVTSDKQEYAAHTIRRKLHNVIEPWLVEPDTVQSHPHHYKNLAAGASWKEVDEIVRTVPACGIAVTTTSGEQAARAALTSFLDALDNYATGRNDPNQQAQSNLSPYLHYGQLSSLRIALTLLDVAEKPPQLLRAPKMPSISEPATRQDSIDAFIEELVVRKELSDNYCFYSPSYSSLDGAATWAQKTLAAHASDPREFTYTQKQFEEARTHDDLWNAAQLQLRKSGKMHGYMRMYWAKKILEWSDNPEQAIRTAIYLNDHYSIDGGDPNGYVGILWSIAGLHDRPWFERSIYGTIRYMSDSGLRKKFDTEQYKKDWL